MTTDILHTRKCFYVGGNHEYGNARASSPSGCIVTGQIYVEELRPVEVRHKYPIVFWPGTGSTGACWITTPDGRPGWASYFLDQGYIIYLVDPPERGRSQAVPDTGRFVVIDNEYAQNFWTCTKDNSGPWPTAHLHSQWSDSGKLGDGAFDQFLAGQVQSRANYSTAETNAQKAGQYLLNRIGPAILCTHSSGGSHGWLIADAVPNLVKAVVALEPLGPPFVNRLASAVAPVHGNHRIRPYGITTAAMTYEPSIQTSDDLKTETLLSSDRHLCDTILQVEPARKLLNLSHIPVLVVTGESGYHSHYDHATVSYMRQAGVNVEHMKLSDMGIKGNGHFMFLEKNSDEIAEAVLKWLRSIAA